MLHEYSTYEPKVPLTISSVTTYYLVEKKDFIYSIKLSFQDNKIYKNWGEK